MVNNIVWHYTTGEKLLRIVEDGYLRPTMVNVPQNENPILWFSANQHWEATANKGVIDPETGVLRTLTMEETMKLGGGLVRFGVDRSRLHPWPKIGRKARIQSSEISALEVAAKESGSDHQDWYGTTKIIPVSEVERIDVIDESGKWIRVDKEEEG